MPCYARGVEKHQQNIFDFANATLIEENAHTYHTAILAKAPSLFRDLATRSPTSDRGSTVRYPLLARHGQRASLLLYFLARHRSMRIHALCNVIQERPSRKFANRESVDALRAYVVLR